MYSRIFAFHTSGTSLTAKLGTSERGIKNIRRQGKKRSPPALEQSPLDLVAQDDVQRVRDLVRVHADECWRNLAVGINNHRAPDFTDFDISQLSYLVDNFVEFR